MAKGAAVSVRIDEELKNEAQKVLDEMGLPMSLAVELFLRQIVEKRRLPFAIGVSDESDPEREERERQFWQSFITWYFDAWPRFDSHDMREKAMCELGFVEKAPGLVAQDYILGDSPDFSKMDEMQRAAYIEVSTLRMLVSDAKELIYWALGMDKLFVPGLSAKYANEVDKWRYQRLWSRKAESLWGRDLARAGLLVADVAPAGGSAAGRTALADEKLLDMCREWLMGCPCDEDILDRLIELADKVDDPDVMREALEAADLLDDFETYLFECSQGE